MQIAAISQQASETEGETQESYSDPLGSFDIRAVVSATEDLFQFILSDKGSRVRVFLVRDIVKAADVFYQDEFLNNLLDEKLRARRLFGYEVYFILLFMQIMSNSAYYQNNGKVHFTIVDILL